MSFIWQPVLISNFVGIEDTPVWMICLDKEGEYIPVLVAWHNVSSYPEQDFLTLKTFGTRAEAAAYLEDFWDSYWRLVG